MRKFYGIVAANFNTLFKVAQKQFSKSKGLRLNSKAWKIYVRAGVANFVDFLINGIVNTTTTTATDEQTYEQIIQFEGHSKLSEPVLLLLLFKVPDQEVIEFIETFLFNSRTRVKCGCPAFKYWGFEYILTRMNSVYGEGERRYPIERNPNKEGVFCKHLWVVTDSLYNKREKFVQNILPFYKRSLDVSSPEKLKKKIIEYGKDGIKRLYAKSVLIVKKTENSKIQKSFESLANKYMPKLLKEVNKKQEAMTRGLNRVNRQFAESGEKTILDETEGLDLQTLGLLD